MLQHVRVPMIISPLVINKHSQYKFLKLWVKISSVHDYSWLFEKEGVNPILTFIYRYFRCDILDFWRTFVYVEQDSPTGKITEGSYKGNLLVIWMIQSWFSLYDPRITRVQKISPPWYIFCFSPGSKKKKRCSETKVLV